MGSARHNDLDWRLEVPSGSHPSAYFLVGPTASGKTEIAHVIARNLDAVILSADSMLVYRDMNIGTAKPTEHERHGIVYFGMDVVPPSETFNVAQFLECARSAWQYCVSHRVPLLVVGGTGLYVKCLAEGLADAPAADPELRKRAETILEREGVEGLYRILRATDRRIADSLKDRRNPRRLIRAMELAWQKAAPPAGWRGLQPRPMAGLKLPRAVLAERIAQRVRRMYERGLLDEMRQLLAAGPLSPTARQAIGYAEAAAVLKGEITMEDAMARTVRRTRQLAKRQMTWFRHQANVQWLEVGVSEDVRETAERVVALWKEHGSVDLYI